MVGSSFLIILIIVGITWYHFYNKTTFGNILNENISNLDEISHIVIRIKKSATNETLWARIDDQKTIDQLITEQSKVPLKKQLTKRNRVLKNAMIIHSQSESYFFDFEEGYLVGNENDYQTFDRDFMDAIDKLNLKWETGDEFLGVE